MWKVKRMKPARIVILLIALVAGGIAALLASRSDQPPPVAPVAQMETVDVLVAAADIGLGTTVAGPELRWQTWPQPSRARPSCGRATAPTPSNSSQARSRARRSTAGEPIRETKLIKAKGSGYMAAILPAGMRAVSTEISPETGAGGFILPNDHVDVLLSRRDKEAEKAAGVDVHVSETILTNIRVLAIDQMVEEKNGQRVVVGKTATLELAPSQAETLGRARQMGTLSLALRSIVDFDSKEVANDEGSGGRRNSINVVRFGVATTTTSK